MLSADQWTRRSAAAEPASRPSRGRTAVIAAVGVLASAGLAAGLVLGLGGGTAQQPIAPAPTPAATPSAAVETLQRELGQLNYYEGPVNGPMTPQTVQAITYLQRDAHLPQTGTMNAATQAALVTCSPRATTRWATDPDRPAGPQ